MYGGGADRERDWGQKGSYIKHEDRKRQKW